MEKRQIKKIYQSDLGKTLTRHLPTYKRDLQTLYDASETPQRDVFISEKRRILIGKETNQRD